MAAGARECLERWLVHTHVLLQSSAQFGPAQAGRVPHQVHACEAREVRVACRDWRIGRWEETSHQCTSRDPAVLRTLSPVLGTPPPHVRIPDSAPRILKTKGWESAADRSRPASIAASRASPRALLPTAEIESSGSTSSSSAPRPTALPRAEVPCTELTYARGVTTKWGRHAVEETRSICNQYAINMKRGRHAVEETRRSSPRCGSNAGWWSGGGRWGGGGRVSGWVGGWLVERVRVVWWVVEQMVVVGGRWAGEQEVRMVVGVVGG